MIKIGFEEEEWKVIKKFKKVIDDYYEISNYGNVRIKCSHEPVKTKIANKKNHPYIAAYMQKKEW